MPSLFRFKSTKEQLSATEIATLRAVSPHAVAEIHRRAKAKESLLDIQVFSRDWPRNKLKVVGLIADIDRELLPLAIYSVHVSETAEAEKRLTVEQAWQRLRFIREIRLQRDMITQLENGRISSPFEYEPLSDNEA